jgi:hypothetical protein
MTRHLVGEKRRCRGGREALLRSAAACFDRSLTRPAVECSFSARRVRFKVRTVQSQDSSRSRQFKVKTVQGQDSSRPRQLKATSAQGHVSSRPHQLKTTSAQGHVSSRRTQRGFRGRWCRVNPKVRSTPRAHPLLGRCICIDSRQLCPRD